MPAWFDIFALEDAQPQEDKVGLERSLKLIRQLIDELIDSGVPKDKIIIGGFSQGGALAMYCLFQEMKAFAGAFSWSGYLPRGETIPDNAGTPVLLTHGTQDPVIPAQSRKRDAEDAGRCRLSSAIAYLRQTCTYHRPTRHRCLDTLAHRDIAERYLLECSACAKRTLHHATIMISDVVTVLIRIRRDMFYF